MNLIKENENYIKTIFEKAGYTVSTINLVTSSRRDLGQYQVNEALSLAKTYHKSPMVIANEVVSLLDDRFSNVTVANPGFINITFSNKYLINYMNDVKDNIDEMIVKEKDELIIMDYGGANAAKALHVGHMRSANIGQAVNKIAKKLGKEVISDVHIGDVGRQSGMVISQILDENPSLPFFDENYKGKYPEYKITIEELNVLYPKANKLAKESDEYMQKVRNITSLVEDNYLGYMDLWKQIVDVSKEDIKNIYSNLNCHFDLWEGELDALEYKDKVLDKFKDILYKSEGALVVDVKEETDTKELPPLILITSNNSTKYETRDLGTLISRMERFKPSEIWYFTDERQREYFESVFRGAYKAGICAKDVKLRHFSFGTVNGKDNKPYKTRDGGVLTLSQLINIVKEKLDTKLSTDIENRSKTLDILTIGVIKYADLLPFRTTSYIFDVDKFCSFEGKTGPYIMYTLVRIKSILNKVNNESSNIINIYSEEEENIYLKVLEYNNIIHTSYNEASASYLCEYIFELCSLFNTFYTKHNIINEKDKDIYTSYVSLCKLVLNIGNDIMDLLAIDVPNRM